MIYLFLCVDSDQNTRMVYLLGVEMRIDLELIVAIVIGFTSVNL